MAVDGSMGMPVTDGGEGDFVDDFIFWRFTHWDGAIIGIFFVSGHMVTGLAGEFQRSWGWRWWSSSRRNPRTAPERPSKCWSRILLARRRWAISVPKR